MSETTLACRRQVIDVLITGGQAQSLLRLTANAPSFEMFRLGHGEASNSSNNASLHSISTWGGWVQRIEAGRACRLF